MLAVVKTPRIDIRIEGDIPPRLLGVLKEDFGRRLHVLAGAADKVNFFRTAIYKTAKKEMTPGTYLRIYRDNLGWSQDELGHRLGVTGAYVCDMEKGRRGVSKETAKKLAGLFGISAERFI